MRIKTNTPIYEDPIGEICPGVCFSYDGEYYIRTSQRGFDDNFCRCINLETGGFRDFNIDDCVRIVRIEAEVIE